MELIFVAVVVVAFIKLLSMAPKSQAERDMEANQHNCIEARKELFARLYKETGDSCYKLN